MKRRDRGKGKEERGLLSLFSGQDVDFDQSGQRGQYLSGQSGQHLSGQLTQVVRVVNCLIRVVNIPVVRGVNI